jgi:hypothetical protein
MAVSAVRLAHVCRRWRAIALDTSKLWATILLTGSPARDTAHLNFYASHAESRLLSIHWQCSRWLPSFTLLSKLMSISQRWRDVTLYVGNQSLEKLDDVRPNIPALNSLSLHITTARDGADTNAAFQQAPSLGRVCLGASGGAYVWPFSFVLPWEQITYLTLNRISLSVFPECIRNCPHLLYFNAEIHPLPNEMVQPIAHLQSPLRKLVLRGPRCAKILISYTFPNLLSFSLELHRCRPYLFAFLARSSHLEMLALSSPSPVPTDDLLALMLAAPSLRIVHFRSERTALVTPKFHTRLLAPAPDDLLLPVEPQSLAELGVEECIAFNDAALLVLIKERCPSLDPRGIEKERLEIAGVPHNPEAELDYLLFDITHSGRI